MIIPPSRAPAAQAARHSASNRVQPRRQGGRLRRRAEPVRARRDRDRRRFRSQPGPRDGTALDAAPPAAPTLPGACVPTLDDDAWRRPRRSTQAGLFSQRDAEAVDRGQRHPPAGRRSARCARARWPWSRPMASARAAPGRGHPGHRIDTSAAGHRRAAGTAARHRPARPDPTRGRRAAGDGARASSAAGAAGGGGSSAWTTWLQPADRRGGRRRSMIRHRGCHTGWRGSPG